MFKKMKFSVLLSLIVIFAGLIVYGFGLLDSAYDVIIMVAVVAAGAFMFFNLIKEKTTIEKFYEKVNLQCNGKFMKFIGKENIGKGIAYFYDIPLGLSKADYQKYQPALEQHLKRNVEFSFYEHLTITVLNGPLEKYR